jgi:hypothetical protein
LSAEGGFLYWHFHGPVSKETEKAADKPTPVIQQSTPTPVPEPTLQPPVQSVVTPAPAKPKLISTYKKMVLVCDRPKPAKRPTPKERKAELAKYVDLMQKVFGLTVKSTLGEDELTLQVAPQQVDATSAIPTLEETYLIKRAGDQLFVTITKVVGGGDMAALFASFPVDPDDAATKQVVGQIEQLTHSEAGKCKLI